MRALALGLLLSLPALAQHARPQMSAAEAAHHLPQHYLDGWQPGSNEGRAPDFIVAADGSGTHRSVQAALDALPAQAAGDGKRWLIQIQPGRYVEQLCAQGRAPFTLRGDPGTPSRVTLSHSLHAALPQSQTKANPCMAHGRPEVGTAGSASVALLGDNIQLVGLSIRNDALEAVRQGQGYPAGSGETGGAQAVALLLEGDRLLLDQVELWGHQDTFYARRPPGSLGRMLVRRSLIAGDVDFIFGNARLVIDQSRILSRAGRRGPGEGGIVFAPSTAPGERYGFLVTHSELAGEPGLSPASVALGRAWDAGVKKGEWQPGVSPNGQLLIRDSRLGPHLGPWVASTARRPYTAVGETAARLTEYNNQAAPGLGVNP